MTIEAINLAQGLALTNSGDVVTIDTYLDAEGDECESGNATAFVAQLPSGEWVADRCDSYESVTLQ